MPPVSHMGTKSPAAWERLRPILIDLILLQMGWPTLGLKMGLKDLIVCCFALCFAQWGLLRLGG
jgi:hypothetical protein